MSCEVTQPSFHFFLQFCILSFFKQFQARVEDCLDEEGRLDWIGRARKWGDQEYGHRDRVSSLKAKSASSLRPSLDPSFLELIRVSGCGRASMRVASAIHSAAPLTRHSTSHSLSISPSTGPARQNSARVGRNFGTQIQCRSRKFQKCLQIAFLKIIK